RMPILAALAVVAFVAYQALKRPFPSDRTPEGAYMRIARAIAEDRPEDAFAYLETDSEWACYTIRDLRKKAVDRARASFPAGERDAFVAEHGAEADAKDGADVFALFARRRKWVARLRRDLSGVARVE